MLRSITYCSLANKHIIVATDFTGVNKTFAWVYFDVCADASFRVCGGAR